jgi:putative addiction module killer protein
MVAVRRTAVFSSWLSNLRDDRAEARIEVRIDRMEQGNPGDVRSVGEGVRELRIHYGPGYRVYFVDRGREVIILLCGGDKSSRSAYIARAKQMAKEV